jgi:hypothetical protein
MSKRNTERFDLSDRLIHFFRPLDLESNDAPVTPEDWGFGNLVEDTKLSPFFLLRSAVRHNRLWATWSIRGGRRTIYGRCPSVCFTEMPLAAFIEAGHKRAERGEAMSPYALMFSKAALFQIGARPVIYALSPADAVLPNGDGGRIRLIPPELLPEAEQYRYVTFNPSGSRPLDWSHEREWRWPYRGPLPHEEGLGAPNDSMAIPGLELSFSNLAGIGAVVKTERQAQQLTCDVLTKVDRGDLAPGHYSHILCLSRLPSARDLIDPQEVKRALETGLIDLEPYFDLDSEQGMVLTSRFTQIIRSAEESGPTPENGEPGACWLWLLDNAHPLTRYLSRDGQVYVSREGRYLVDPWEFSDSRSLRQREEMTRQLADRVKSEFNLPCSYFSVLGHSDPNGLPFYSDVLPDNHLFYNYADDGVDY